MFIILVEITFSLNNIINFLGEKNKNLNFLEQKLMTECQKKNSLYFIVYDNLLRVPVSFI